MAATWPETTCASHARSCQTGTPSPPSISITSVSFLVARAAVRQAAELGRPPMVTKHEENEAPDYCVPLLFNFLPRPKTLIKAVFVCKNQNSKKISGTCMET